MKKLTYKHTVRACYLGYITQAIGNNFSPLLFVMFHDSLGIPTGKITVLIAVNFALQLLVDLLAARFVDRIGYRRAVVAAHIFSAVGIAGLGIFPFVFGDAFSGLLAAVLCYAVGGGLIEVLISPIVEACPSDDKASAMSMLHSFYCWGVVFVILVSTVSFAVFGMSCWRVLAACWAAVPAATAVLFTQVPIRSLSEAEGGESMTARRLLAKPVFWLLAVLMFAAGASELAMVQWASAFAEQGLGVTKSVGDIVGPCLFSALQGVARVFYAKRGGKVDLLKYIIGCGVVCAASYLCASFAPHPALSLLGCALCGLSVGILWPGVFSVAAVRCRGGGTALFALLALAGDVGCTCGPTLVGIVSGAFGDSFSAGLASAAVFPLILIFAAAVCRNTGGGEDNKEKKASK